MGSLRTAMIFFLAAFGMLVVKTLVRGKMRCIDWPNKNTNTTICVHHEPHATSASTTVRGKKVFLFVSVPVFPKTFSLFLLLLLLFQKYLLGIPLPKRKKYLSICVPEYFSEYLCSALLCSPSQLEKRGAWRFYFMIAPQSMML